MDDDYQESDWNEQVAFSNQFHNLRMKIIQAQINSDVDLWYRLLRSLKSLVWPLLSKVEREDIISKLAMADTELFDYNKTPGHHPNKSRKQWKVYNYLEITTESLIDYVNKHMPMIKLKTKFDFSMI